jgi:hypothetical protein
VIVSGAPAPDEPRTAEASACSGCCCSGADEDRGAARAAITGGSRNELYAQALALKKEAPPAAGKRRKGRKARDG